MQSLLGEGMKSGEAKRNSRMIFKAQLKVEWQPKNNIECYIPKC